MSDGSPQLLPRLIAGLRGLGRWARRHPPRAFALLVGALVVVLCTHWFFTSKHHRGSTAEPSTDGRYYFTYLPSMVFDRDLDLSNQYQRVGNYFHYPRTATGRPGNVFSVGPALYALPWYLSGHLLARLRGERADGYSATEKAGAMLASLLFSLGALFFAYRLLRRRLGDRFATVLAVLLCAAGGPVVYYAIRQPGYSHPFAAFWVAWLVDAWDRSFDRRRAPRSLRTWVGLGLLLGFAALARTQLVLWGLLYLVAVSDDLRRALRGEGSVRDRLLPALRQVVPRWAAGLGAVVVAFAPQLITWKVIYGQWLLVPQGSAFLRWSEPAWHEVLFSARNGLFPWAPLYALAGVGLLAALRRHPRLAGALLFGVALQVWTNGAVWDWWAGVAFGARRFDACFVAFAFGLGFLLVRATWQGKAHWGWRVARTTAVVGAGALAALLAWGNLSYAAKMDCTKVRGHHRGPAHRILRAEIPGFKGRAVAWASARVTWPARRVYAWVFGARTDAYDHLVGRHVLNERYPWPPHRRRGGRVTTLRLRDPKAHNLVGFGPGPRPRTVALRGRRGRVLFGLNTAGAVHVSVFARAPGPEPVRVRLKVNGRTVAAGDVDRRGGRIVGRVARPARGTNALDVLAGPGVVVLHVRFRHEGWPIRTP